LWNILRSTPLIVAQKPLGARFPAGGLGSLPLD